MCRRFASRKHHVPGMYRTVRAVLFLELVVIASCVSIEANLASTPRPDSREKETLRESGSHPFYSTVYTDPFATRSPSARADDNRQESSKSDTSDVLAQRELTGQAFEHPTSFEFGQTINHAVAAQAAASSPSLLEQNLQAYKALPRSEHGDYRAEATLKRNRDDDVRYGADSEDQDPIYASATGGYDGQFPGGDYGSPQATSRYYGYGGGGSPKGYNTQRAYAYEKVYPEQRYSTNHAVAYEKHYNDDDRSPRRSYRSFTGGYGPSSGGYGSASEGYGYPKRGFESRYDSNPAATSEGRDGGRPQMRSYVYKNPYDKSTMRVVEMHSGSPGASSSLSKIFSKPGSIEAFVANLMRNGKDGLPF